MRYLVLLAAIVLCGCKGDERTDPSIREKNYEFAKTWNLPPNAKNVVYHGNNWYEFDMSYGSTVRRYLYHYDVGESRARECITELK